MFILGRAVAGVGAAGLSSGSLMILTQCFPSHKRPLWTTVIGSSQLIGIVSAPLVGGGLIDWVGWRACFGINLPLGADRLRVGSVWLPEPGQQFRYGAHMENKAETVRLGRHHLSGAIYLLPALGFAAG